MTPTEAPERTLPRENLFRAISPGFELRAADDDDEQPRMVGHFAVFNQWTRIDSIFEGTFMERFVPGAFKKTMRENRDSMRVLFQHGRDPQVGNKPLGPIDDLKEDREGAYYEVPLLDASYVRDLVLPGLEAGLYGASFRFSVIREEFNAEPGKSAHNPEGIPERSVKEASVPEFGPVTFPAYEGASAGVRSVTDEFLFGQLTSDPERLRELIAFVERAELAGHRTNGGQPPDEQHQQDPSAPSTPDAGERATSGPERRDPTSTDLYGLGRQEEPTRTYGL